MNSLVYTINHIRSWYSYINNAQSAKKWVVHTADIYYMYIQDSTYNFYSNFREFDSEGFGYSLYRSIDLGIFTHIEHLCKDLLKLGSSRGFVEHHDVAASLVLFTGSCSSQDRALFFSKDDLQQQDEQEKYE